MRCTAIHRIWYKASHQWRVSGPKLSVLRDNPRLVAEIAVDLLEQNFPHSMHADILDAVGIDLSMETVTRMLRGPQFRSRVLTVYGESCTVCPMFKGYLHK